MNNTPKTALEDLKKSAEVSNKAVSTLEEYIEEWEKRMKPAKGHQKMNEEQAEALDEVYEFVPKTVQDEYRNKIFIRLMNNFTFEQLEVIENLGKVHYKKQKNYKD